MERVRTTLAGRYGLAEVIGRGGMSTVYRATDPRLGRTVAVKVLDPVLAEEDPLWVVRFEREARAAASLAHPGVATVYDVGVQDGTRFIVMEYVRGRSLATILREHRPLAPASAAAIAASVADVLSAAHAKGIVHRDIKPGNVIVLGNGSVKVLDFGIARPLDGPAITQTASVLGTAAYMSPEQAIGEVADPRSDIYSLGCVLYAMLAGSPPFSAELPAAILHQHVNATPRPLADIAPGVPSALEALVSQMLAKNPAARPRTAAEVRDRLYAIRRSSGNDAAAAAPTAATVPVAPLVRGKTRGAPLLSRPGDVVRRAMLGSLAVLLTVALIALASGGGSSRNTNSPDRSTATTPGSAPTTSSTSAGSTKPAAAKPKKEHVKPSENLAAPASQGAAPSGHGGTPPGQAKKDHGHGGGGEGGD